ncbi:MAG: hypothetical protein IPP03_01875 [Dechloromonas sp.]|jgi:hypothetical protein|nr:hypothetical protein [Candidatus Dechloromonas phosphoritropha]
MARPNEHKCLFCGVMFCPDRRNAGHQKYCSQANCRKASKAASRRAWLAKPENQNYFSGPEHVVRVQAWRVAHPGYWQRPKGARSEASEVPLALQDLCPPQVFEIIEDAPILPELALQDLWREQPAVLIGFIAQFTGSALQDDIAKSTRRLLELGHDILAGRIGDDPQTHTLPRAAPADTGPVQLG